MQEANPDATWMKFTPNRLGKSDNRVEVNTVDVGERKGIGINDICCGELGEKGGKRLVKLLNSYRDYVPLDFRELGKTPAAEVKIESKDDEPVYHKPR